MHSIKVLLMYHLVGMRKNKFMICVIIVGVLIMLILSMGLNGDFGVIKKKVAVYCQEGEHQNELNQVFTDQDRIKLYFMNTMPEDLELINGKYAALITETSGKYLVTTYQQNETIEYIKAALKKQNYQLTEAESLYLPQTIGFLTIFLLMISKLLLGSFLEERENGIYQRILMGQATHNQYAISEILFTIILTMVPTIVVSAVFFWICPIKLDIDFPYYTLLIGFISIVGSSFSFMVSNLFTRKTTVEFVSSMVILLTSILGGAIVDVKDTNQIIRLIRMCLPQKRLIDLADRYSIQSLLYLIILSIVLFVVGLYMGKRNLHKEAY